jgi:sterol desaturase/sphingolipid hydroxylase (fatty acid hydroxylase superfamily)
MTPMPSWLPALVRRTRGEYFADFWITPPITLALAIYSISHGFSWRWCVAFVVGWAAWTLYEYAVHRLSHHAPWLSDLHWLHHRNQKDYIALHPVLTLLNYAVIWLLFGINAAPFAIGFSTGYVVYAALHTAFHYAQILEGDCLWRLKRHHVTHHRFHDCCFGVSATIWDRAFGTFR